jgi:hypothetical protein
VRRFLAFGLAWLAAAVVAAVVAWQGVGLIGEQVTTGDRPATLTAAQVDAALAASPSSTTTTSEPAGPPTTAPAPGGATPTTTTPPGPGPAPAETHTFAMSGGSATLRFAPEGVTVVWATPNPGYQVRQGPGDNGGLRVEFDGDAGRSRVDAWWDGGARWRVQDDGADGGQGGDDRGRGGGS